ncbi:MAG: redoxin domain-containing protein [Chloroflexi bacterium]|nr:redoxin domain-containing protein [Chloroflexota bacterium]
MPFPLLSDADRSVAQAYQALKPNGKSIQRTVLILDQEGTIRYVKQGMPKDSDLLDAIREMGS